MTGTDTAPQTDTLEGLDFTPACDVDSCDGPAVAVRTHRPSQCPVLLCTEHRHQSDTFLATRLPTRAIICTLCRAQDLRVRDFVTSPLT